MLSKILQRLPRLGALRATIYKAAKLKGCTVQWLKARILKGEVCI